MTQQSQERREKHGAGQEKAAVSNLAAKMAHELNNPLDAVLRFVSLAQRKAKLGEYSDLDRYLSDAQFGLQRMAEVLRELMDIGRETHEILERTKPVALSDLIGRATRTAAALAEQKNVSLIVKSLLPDGIAPSYDLRVAQVLSNLVKNAVEATAEGTAVRLTALSREGDRNLVLLVEDCGPGIPPEMLPELFRPFVTSKAKGAGFGLGLAISRELVESIGGTLTLDNRTNGATGCVATMTLPMTPHPSAN